MNATRQSREHFSHMGNFVGNPKGVVVSKTKPDNLTSMYLMSNGVLAGLLLDELKRNSAFDGQEPLRKMVREAACRLQKLS